VSFAVGSKRLALWLEAAKERARARRRSTATPQDLTLQAGRLPWSPCASRCLQSLYARVSHRERRLNLRPAIVKRADPSPAPAWRAFPPSRPTPDRYGAAFDPGPSDMKVVTPLFCAWRRRRPSPSPPRPPRRRDGRSPSGPYPRPAPGGVAWDGAGRRVRQPDQLNEEYAVGAFKFRVEFNYAPKPDNPGDTDEENLVFDGITMGLDPKSGDWRRVAAYLPKAFGKPDRSPAKGRSDTGVQERPSLRDQLLLIPRKSCGIDTRRSAHPSHCPTGKAGLSIAGAQPAHVGDHGRVVVADARLGRRRRTSTDAATQAPFCTVTPG